MELNDAQSTRFNVNEVHGTSTRYLRGWVPNWTNCVNWLKQPSLLCRVCVRSTERWVWVVSRVRLSFEDLPAMRKIFQQHVSTMYVELLCVDVSRLFLLYDGNACLWIYMQLYLCYPIITVWATMILIFIFRYRYLNQHEKREENQIHEKIVKRKVGSWDPWILDILIQILCTLMDASTDPDSRWDGKIHHWRNSKITQKN